MTTAPVVAGAGSYLIGGYDEVPRGARRAAAEISNEGIMAEVAGRG